MKNPDRSICIIINCKNFYCTPLQWLVFKMQINLDAIVRCNMLVCSQDRRVRDHERDRKIFSRPRPRPVSNLASRLRPAKFKTETGEMTSSLFFFDLKKSFVGLKFAHKLVLWVYRLSQITNCFSQSDYVIKTSWRSHFMQIFTEIIFEECPWPTKRRRLHMSLNVEKIRESTFAQRFVYLTRKTLLYVGDTKKEHKNSTAL